MSSKTRNVRDGAVRRLLADHVAEAVGSGQVDVHATGDMPPDPLSQPDA